jgi:hypothetical protein
LLASDELGTSLVNDGYYWLESVCSQLPRSCAVSASQSKSCIPSDPINHVPQSITNCKSRYEYARFDGNDGDPGSRTFLSRTGTRTRSRACGTHLIDQPAVAALTGMPAGRTVDRFGAQRMTIIGLIGIAIGCLVLSFVPVTFGIARYITPIICVTANYALFQAANNTAIM